MSAANSRNLSVSSGIGFYLLYSLLFLFPCFSIDEQGQALLSWKSTLNTSGDVLTAWSPSDANPCKWVGIRCNSNGDVIEITLQFVDLQGLVPSNLQPLKSLTALVLAGANLTGRIPREIGDYSHLRLLDLSGNSLSGEIPGEISRLGKLQSLYLNSNSLEGEIPSDIGNLSSLVHLALYDNHLAGRIPASIGKLRKLEIFRAGGNQNLKGELPPEIGNCTGLVMLGLAETGISGSLPKSIGGLKRLETIAIYTASLSGPIPEEVGNCTGLRNVYLYQNLISGPIPTRLGELQQLRNLLLWQNSLAGPIPSELGDCRELVAVDLSENLLTGAIPASLGNLAALQEVQLSVNQLSGTIPSQLSNCSSLTHLELDNNGISGEIDVDFGKLKNLTLFFAWRNNLTGNIPANLAECSNLQALDLSYNSLTGSVPKLIFELKNLTKLLLLSNELSGILPPEIGNCTTLHRLRLNGNRLAGAIPAQIGSLTSLSFLDLGSNRFTGQIPPAISDCENLEFIDFHSNGLMGSLPQGLPRSLQFLDASDNGLTGPLTSDFGSLTQLTKLILGKNRLSGEIPSDLGSCSKLQQLDLGGNAFYGEIPPALGRLPALEISLNLSYNYLSGHIPAEFAGLEKLATLDLSNNHLSGDLSPLSSLQNLVSLNLSGNDFSGQLPDSPFFRKLPLSDLAGNPGLYIAAGQEASVGPADRTSPAMKLLLSVLLSASAVILLLASYVAVRTRLGPHVPGDEAWETTFFQKTDIRVEEVLKRLVSENVVGTGSSGAVYRVDVPGGPTLAVKKMWAGDESEAFRSEIGTLGSIRHRNIVRLVGWGRNRTTKLLFYDYLPNGSLSGLLHGGGKCGAGWDARYEIVLGVAHALAYLHHDCLPAIMHGDVKTMNVLLGPTLEPYLADFGLARAVVNGCDSNDASARVGPRPSPSLAGSYGYMAPEYASPQRITEKSDVYSYGVVLLEVLTGRHPLDPTLPGGTPLVQWVRDHFQVRRDPMAAVDQRLRGEGWESQTQEIHQVLAIAILCVSALPQDRPTMKDVVALLKEIRRPDGEDRECECDDLRKGHPTALAPASPPRRWGWQGSSNCSFAFSDSSG